MPSVMAVMNLATLPGLPTYDSSILTSHGRSHSRYQYTHSQRDRPHAYYVPRHRRHYSRSQSCPHSHCDRSSSFRTHTLLPATKEAHTALQPMDVPVTPWAMISTGIVAPIPTHHFSHRHHSHHSTDQSFMRYVSTSHHAAQEPQHRKVKQHPRPSTSHKPHHPKTVTIQDGDPETLHQILTVTLTL